MQRLQPLVTPILATPASVIAAGLQRSRRAQGKGDGRDCVANVVLAAASAPPACAVSGIKGTVDEGPWVSQSEVRDRKLQTQVHKSLARATGQAACLCIRLRINNNN